MYNNSYLGNGGYGNQMYSSYPQNYANYQQQMMQRQMQQPQTYMPQDVPFNDIKFVTADEARAYIVMPNTKVMLMDRDKSIFYIKSADAMGKSTLEGFKYSKIDENSTETQTIEFDTKEFVKMDDLKDFITKNDISNFITKDELKEIDTKLENIQKRIKINEILKGDETSGQ